MQTLGFRQKWRDILSVLWRTMMSRIILNGETGNHVQHGRGLRQGDPLSLMIFILIMDPPQRLLDTTTQAGLLSPIGVDPIKLRMSLYADDAAMFLRPVVTDVANLQELLTQFGQATGMCTNIQKSVIVPINCNEIDIPSVLGDFQVALASLPCK
jgi:hypothetical protein